MPGPLRVTRSSSSASLKLWERKTNTMAFTQSLMDQDLCRSDSMNTASSKRRSFSLRRNNSSRAAVENDFVDDFSQVCPGSVADEEGIETILPPLTITRIHSLARTASSVSKSAATSQKQQHQSSKRKSKSRPPPTMVGRRGWRCLPSTNNQEVPQVVTAQSSSEGSRQERFDQSFDYAFDAVVWDKHTSNPDLESSRVDTTFASNDDSASCTSAHAHTDPPALPAPENTAGKHSKKPFKWKRFFWGGRRKVQRSQSMSSSSKPTRTERELTPKVEAREWPPEPELEDEPDWEAHVMEGDEIVECEYRGDVTVQDWFSAAPDSPTIQRVASWGLNQSQLGLEKKHEDDAFPNSATGVMELGQYAREMQSKSASTNKPSTSTPSPTPTTKRQVPSLLCVLPKFSSGKNREVQHREQVEEVVEEDFPDPDFELDESLDDNSFLAVSYTEDGAPQLVMSQSEDIERLEAEELSLGKSPETYIGLDDSGYMEEGFGSPPEEKAVDISGLTTLDQSLQFLGENDIMTYQGSIRSTRGNSLGARYPHPAAQMRDEFAMQLRQVRHPSSFSNEEGDEAASPKEEKVQPTDPVGDVSSCMTPPNVEKERLGSITFHHYKGELYKGALAPNGQYVNQKPAPEPQEESPPPPRRETPPWVPKRRDDPPAPRSYGFYGCPTATSMPRSCTAGSIRSAPRWMSSPTETGSTCDHSGPTARTLGSRTVSTLSYSVYPLQERRSFISSRDIRDLYEPIRELAKEVNETLCENIYPRSEQPASVPFDEFAVDGRRREGLPSWTEVVRTKSSSSSNNYYERRPRDRPPRPEPSPEADMDRRPEPSQKAPEVERRSSREQSQKPPEMERRSSREPSLIKAPEMERRSSREPSQKPPEMERRSSRPDPPSAIPRQRDTRTQLV